MPCSLSATLTAACSSGIGKLNNRVGLLKVIAQTFASRLPSSLSSDLSQILSRACTSGIGKENNPLTLLRIIAQNICNQNSGNEAMVVTELASAISSATLPTYSTDTAYQPAPNSLVLAFVMMNRAGSGNAIPSFSGNGVTWEVIDSVSYSTGGINRCMGVLRALDKAPVSGVGTVDWGRLDITGSFIRIIQVTNVKTSGTNGSGAIAQTINGGTTGANPTITLTNPINTNGLNSVFGVSDCNSAAPYGASPEAGWSTLFDSGTSSTGIFGTYALNTTDQSVNLTKAASAIYRMIAFEVNSINS